MEHRNPLITGNPDRKISGSGRDHAGPDSAKLREDPYGELL